MAGKQPEHSPRRARHVPQRSCVVCRRQFDKRRLTRVVRTPENGVRIDPTGKQNGRGAYLCDQATCWDKAIRQAAILNQALNAQLTDAELAAIAADPHRPATPVAEADN